MRKRFSSALAVLLLVSFSKVAMSKPIPEENVRLNGRSLFSFTPDFYMLQTENYLFKIARSALTSDLRVQFENASVQGRNINVELPRSAIQFLWPTQPDKGDREQAKVLNESAVKLISEARSHGGRISLKGNAAFSFSEGYFLVQVAEKVFQVRKSMLDLKQLGSLNAAAGTGARVELDIPKNAVSLAWSLKQAPEVKNAAGKVDEVRLENMQLTIRGTVLCSFDEPHLLIESLDTYYLLRKSGVVAQNMDFLDRPGSRVQITVPIEAVEFSWSTKTNEFRLPEPQSRAL